MTAAILLDLGHPEMIVSLPRKTLSQELFEC